MKVSIVVQAAILALLGTAGQAGTPRATSAELTNQIEETAQNLTPNPGHEISENGPMATVAGVPVSGSGGAQPGVHPEKLGAPRETVKLVLDKLYENPLKFSAGGVPVHLFVDYSHNAGEVRLAGPFIGFFQEGMQAPKYFNATWEMTHMWPIVNATAHMTLNGAAYQAFINPDRGDPGQSTLVIQSEGKTEATFTMAQMSKAIYAQGQPVTISGKSLRVYYTRGFDEGPGRPFAFTKFDPNPSVIFYLEQDGKMWRYFIDAEKIKKPTVQLLTPTFRYEGNPMNPEAENILGRVGLRISDSDELEVYYPIPASF